MEKEKTRYNDDELQEFREIILKKMEIAKDEFKTIQNNLRDGNQGGGVGTNNNYLTLDDGADTFEKENLNQLAAHQLKFIKNLEAAIVRIENKTYGICKTSGKLIPKERLRAVPHTTQTIEAKLKR
ncbi:MAG: TraR/DksA C4-type zinc finger protein [Bacteroidetes bacterium]|jgi:DnaK suppressor protein|nr:TraR/DksA C4-type zinc finger protein [Bacteroidota bacterium]MDA0783618.1 TraR/DksA C4-type zinc finger protein [Bacteroidota bacterium]MDA1224623.1 TraR/DksA C4-type zinc finger protein [Bacteroidota bacterium]